MIVNDPNRIQKPWLTSRQLDSLLNILSLLISLCSFSFCSLSSPSWKVDPAGGFGGWKTELFLVLATATTTGTPSGSDSQLSLRKPLNWTSLNEFNCTGCHCSEFNGTGFHCTGFHCTRFYFTGFHFTGFHYTGYHYTGFHYTVFHYRYCTPLNCLSKTAACLHCCTSPTAESEVTTCRKVSAGSLS